MGESLRSLLQSIRAKVDFPDDFGPQSNIVGLDSFAPSDMRDNAAFHSGGEISGCKYVLDGPSCDVNS